MKLLSTDAIVEAALARRLRGAEIAAAARALEAPKA
jgi:hypothetical protein